MRMGTNNPAPIRKYENVANCYVKVSFQYFFDDQC
jgi:hypothetical protein